MARYVLIDPKTDQIVNVIEFDEGSNYDPSPLIMRPEKDGDTFNGGPVVMPDEMSNQ